MAERNELPDMEERQWLRRMYVQQCEIAALVSRLVACLERAPWMVAQGELPASEEPVATPSELPESEAPLPTWILTDERVAHLERAIEEESRVRGQAYGG